MAAQGSIPLAMLLKDPLELRCPPDHTQLEYPQVSFHPTFLERRLPSPAVLSVPAFPMVLPFTPNSPAFRASPTHKYPLVPMLLSAFPTLSYRQAFPPLLRVFSPPASSHSSSNSINNNNMTSKFTRQHPSKSVKVLSSRCRSSPPR